MIFGLFGQLSSIWDAASKHKTACERFEPRPKGHFKSRLSLIVRVNVVLNRAVVVDSD